MASRARLAVPRTRSRAIIAVLAATVMTLVAAAPAGAADSPQKTARSIVLTRGDAPRGWDSLPAERGDPETSADLAACTEEPDPNEGREATARGREFSNPGGDLTYSSEGAVFEDVAAAKDAMRMFRSPLFPECAESQLRADLESSLAPGDTINDIIVSELELPRLGNDRIAMQLLVSVTEDGVVSEGEFVSTLIRRKNLVTEVITEGLGRLFPESRWISLLEDVEEKLDDAVE